MLMRRVLLTGLFALFAACSHDAAPTTLNPPPPPPPPPLGVPGSVTVNDSTFVPDTVSVSAGQDVVWTNMGTTTHNVTSDNAAFAGGNMAPPTGTGTPGGTITVTFGRAGTYLYHCALHPTMKGVVRVTAS
jgi:plastocyanin